MKTSTKPIAESMTLIKFQDKDVINSLRNGLIYAKPLRYFIDLEERTGDTEIGDKSEGRLFIENATVNYSNGRILCKDRTGFDTSASYYGYVFCLSGIDDLEHSSFSKEQKEKIITFGDTALRILDSAEFISRVTQAAERENYDVIVDKITYGSNCINDVEFLIKLMVNINNAAFVKAERFSYQQEYRFLFIPKDKKSLPDHLEINIGNIHDITDVISTKKILM